MAQPSMLSGTPTVALIGGTGKLGRGLAVRFAAAEVSVAIGSRDRERAEVAAERVRTVVPDATVRGVSNRASVDGADAIVVCVPYGAHAETLQDILPSFQAGQLLIDATVPLATAVGGKPSELIVPWRGSPAEMTRALSPSGVKVVAALHTVSATRLAQLDHPLEEDVLICGDDRADREAAAEIIERIPGMRAVHAGGLDMARHVQAITPLLISINRRYKVNAGVRIAGLEAAVGAP